MALTVLTKGEEVPAVYSSAVERKPLTLEIEQTARTPFQKLWQRVGLFPAKRTFQLYPFTLATAAAVCREMETLGRHDIFFSQVETVGSEWLLKHHRCLSRILAMAIANRGKKYKRSHRRLIEEQVTPEELKELMAVVNERLDAKSFVLALFTLGLINILEETPKENTHG